MPHQLSAEMKECIDICNDCFSSCLETANHCLSLGGEHAEQKHIQILQLCAEVCQTASRAMLAESEFHPQLCGVCADICQRCAEECESMGDDETMKRCAEVCRKCADSCREMASTSKTQKQRPRSTGAEVRQ